MVPIPDINKGIQLVNAGLTSRIIGSQVKFKYFLSIIIKKRVLIKLLVEVILLSLLQFFKNLQISKKKLDIYKKIIINFF